MSNPETRNAARIAVNVPVVIEAANQPAMKLHDNLAKVYSRVTPSVIPGESLTGTLRDLSTNGAFIAGPALPLLSRIAIAFELQGFGRVEALGWTLWQRRDDCVIPCEGRLDINLPKGVGILFEAISLDARIAIHRLVRRSVAN